MRVMILGLATTGLIATFMVSVSLGQTTNNSAQLPGTTGSIVGQGAAGKIPKFVGPNKIGNSIMSEAGGTINVWGMVNVETKWGPGIAFQGGNPTTGGSTDVDASYASGIRGVVANTSSPAGISVFAINDATTGDPIGVFGKTTSTFRGIGVRGQAVAETGSGIGVLGEALSASGFAGVFNQMAPNGYPIAVYGYSASVDGGEGVHGQTNATTGLGIGVNGLTSSPDGFGGSFTNLAGGNIMRGVNNATVVFRVDGNGTVFANGGLQPGGADFAESMVVSGDRSRYGSGDLLVIDTKSERKLELSQGAYSTLVAGIYSTKPGMLGSTRKADEAAAQDEVPLAVVGIVPCKVTAENGAIRVGDLLVTSSVPGRAMKGTDRSKMLGAVVGKALEPLPSGEGTIQVLVTLQ
jgi:hypothetical protein